MTEKTVRKHIQNSRKPTEKYSWCGVDRFPDGRNWKIWPRTSGKNIKLTDMPIGTLFEFDALSAIYRIIQKKTDSVIVELVDNQQDQFPEPIGTKKEFENYYICNIKKVRRPNYVCLPEDDVVDKKSVKKAKKANGKINNEWDQKNEGEMMAEMMGSCFKNIMKQISKDKKQ